MSISRGLKRGLVISIEVEGRKSYMRKESGNHQNFQESTDIIASLKACAQKKDLKEGTRIHADVLKRGLLGENCYVASTLVSMYAKCGALPKAAQVLEDLPIRDVVSWNALIAGYVQQGQADKALQCFERMQSEGLNPNAVTLICILKACGSIGAADKGKQIHKEVMRLQFLGKDVVLGNTLVDMYAKFGELAKAAQVLDELPVRDVVSWSTLISAYAQQGKGEEALSCFERMQQEGVSPNAVTLMCSLKACASIGAIDKGKQIHDMILRQGLLEKYIALGNTLVDMYAKCGSLAKAIQVLDELPVRNVVSWNALIAGYAQWGRGEEALKCFERMQCEGLSLDMVTFIGILKACGSMGVVDKGDQIHEEILRRGLLGKDNALGTALVDMYVKCGAFKKAAQVLDELPVRDVISWSALIAGYVEQGQGKEALKCYEQMQLEGLFPNAVTFTCILKACGSIGAVDKGEQIHEQVLGQGLLGKELVLGNTLVDMYAKCGALPKAAQVLDELPVWDVVPWNALIAGYAQHGWGEEALKCYERMQSEGLSPDTVTFICMLKACGSIGAAEEGEGIHKEIVRQGLLGKDIVLDTTLVDMYSKCGALAKAAHMLDKFPVRNVVSWNALIGGYAQQGRGEEAHKCFQQMQGEGLSPNTVTFINILKACGRIGAADKGEQIHGEIANQGLLEKSIVLGNTLVDMYAKCGALTKAAQVLDELPVRDIVSWSALIAGYAQQGQGEEAVKCFECMQGEGFSPNSVTMACMLSACSHSNLLDEGQTYFANMTIKYGIIPDVEHHTCMVDLFGRAGEFVKAVALIKKMPYSDHLPVWHALLGACRECGNVNLGKWAFDNAVQLDKSDAVAYVLMIEIYAAANMQEDLQKIEAMREE